MKSWVDLGMVRNKVEEVALKHGMISIPDTSGTNIDKFWHGKINGLTALPSKPIRG
jgi:hypothetical protein